MSEKKRKCWAECLGDCKGPLTLEHIASASIFHGDTFTSHGMHWAKKGITLKTSQIGSHILCKHHNESTSDLDNCAGKLSTALRSFWRTNRDVVLTLNGEEFERWSCKLLINMMACGWFFPHKATPPQFLVEHVFGRRAIGCRAGLHTIVGIKHHCTPNNFQFMPLGYNKPGKIEIRGIVFNFQSLLFAFFPKCADQKEFINSLGDDRMFKPSKVNVMRHPVEEKLERRSKNQLFTKPKKFHLRFDWPSVNRPDGDSQPT
jgi:hypothetical protein